MTVGKRLGERKVMVMATENGQIDALMEERKGLMKVVDWHLMSQW